jgi:hypothetical protein
MTREEQIKKEALKECSSFDLPDKEGKFKGVNSAYGLGFCEGAKWADKTMIDKACEWLINIDFDGYDFRDCDESFNNDLLVDAFRKEMEK